VIPDTTHLDSGTLDAGIVDPGAPDPLFSDSAPEDEDVPSPLDDVFDAADALADWGKEEDVHDAGEDTGPADVTDKPASFSVLTINLKHPLLGLGDAQKRLQIVADKIVERQPDLVALQEVIREDESQPSFAEQLAEMTGFEWIWEYTFSVPFLFEEGLGILSRWPVIWSDSQFLPHTDLLLFQRKVLGARLAFPHGDMQFFCTHMTTDSNETTEADQALAVNQFITDHPSPLPGFLAGDLNAEPDTLAMRFLRGDAEYLGFTGNLVDAWMTANPGVDGYTIPSNDPDRRIDYIYMVPGTEQTAEVDSCEIVFDKPVGGLHASDHLGVLCHFTIP